MSSPYSPEVVIVGTYNPGVDGEYDGYADALVITPDGKQWQGFIAITKEGVFEVFIYNMSIDTWNSNYNNSTQPITVTVTGNITGNLQQGMSFIISATSSQVSIEGLAWDPSNKELDVTLSNLTNIVSNPNPSAEGNGLLENLDLVAAAIYFITPSKNFAQQLWNAIQSGMQNPFSVPIVFEGVLVSGPNGINQPGYYYDGQNYVIPLKIQINPQILQQMLSEGAQCFAGPSNSGYQTKFCYLGNNTWKISLIGLTVNENTTVTVAIAGA
ncbi:MAG: hypothetical protein [aquatic viral metagenome]